MSASGELTVEDLKAMKVADLRKELANRGLDSKGNKPELIQRLEEVLTGTGSAASDAGRQQDEGEESAANAVGDSEQMISLDIPHEEPATEAGAAAAQPAEAAPPAADTSAVDALLSLEKRRERANRFNIPVVQSEEEKMAERAKRFGIVSEEEKMIKRKAKFGIVSEEDRKAQRAKRFGTSSAADAQSSASPRTASTVKRLESPLPDRQKRRNRGSDKKPTRAEKKARS